MSCAISVLLIQILYIASLIQIHIRGLSNSAGAIGVMLNVDRVSSLLHTLGVTSVDVRGVVDSGWFLDNTPFSPRPCRDAQSCPPLEAARRGLRLWQSSVPADCAALHPPEACFLGYRLYPTIKCMRNKFYLCFIYIYYIFTYKYNVKYVFLRENIKYCPEAENFMHAILTKIHFKIMYSL